MSKRIVAALALTAMTASGCAALCGPDQSACSSTSTVHHHYYEDDDDDVLLMVGAVVGVAAVLAIVAATRGGDDRPPQPMASAPTTMPAAYVVPVPIASNDDEVRLQRMYVQGHLSARAGRCEATVVIGRQLARVSPSYHEQYAADPTIAACLR